MITLRFGENVSGTEYWQNQGTFVIEEAEITNPKSFGLIGIRERTRYQGGELRISGIRGKGTTVTVSIPLESKC